VYLLSASQYAPVVVCDPQGATYTVLWSDRRTGNNYNIMSQAYHVLLTEDISATSRVRQLGRNQFVNADTEIQDAVHGAVAAALTGPGTLAAAWQSDRIKLNGYDIYARALALAPDTCVNDDCRFAPRILLQAALDGQAVRLSWQLPPGSSGARVDLLRYDLAAYNTQSWSRPTVLGSYPADAGSYAASDRIEGAAGGYLYELLRDGAVLATAVPAPVVVRYSLGLSAITPNPARGLARIAFSVPGRSSERVAVKLHVYDVAGRRVRTLVQDTREAGPQVVNWSGDLESGARAGAGVYFLRLEAGGLTACRKMLWLR
jgi:hypothetical protein